MAVFRHPFSAATLDDVHKLPPGEQRAATTTVSNPRFFYLVTAETRYRQSSESLWRYGWRLCFHRRKRSPTGGVKVIYQHCDLLNQHGFVAHPVHLGNFSVDWMDYHCQPLTSHDARRVMSADDILVVPERIPLAAASFPSRRKIVFVQNGGLVDKAVAGKRYEDFGFSSVLCCSEYVSDFMAERTTLPRHAVTNGIRLNLFRPSADRRKQNSVLFLRRKDTWGIGREAIKGLPLHIQRRIEVIEVPNQFTESEMVAFYQQADIFLALGYPEGFALPPLEAMACGCAVVGFTGGGGATHMQDGRTALIVPDGDAAALSQALERVLTNDRLKEQLQRGGLAKSQEFPIARMEGELITFAGRFTEFVS